MSKRPPKGGMPAGPSQASKAARSVSGEVRLIGGMWKRSRLKVLNRPGLRPTPDRVRETLFNWLGADLQGWQVLDAFAGSGALGFEAASRGAASVLMLESDAAAAQELARAHQRLRAPTSVQVQRCDALNWMSVHPAAVFDLVFLDPPFGDGLAQTAVDLALPCLCPGGWLVVESPAPLLPPTPDLTVFRKLQAGAVFMELWRRTG